MDCPESFSCISLLFSPFRTSEGCEMKTEGPPDLPSPLGPTLLLRDFSPPRSLVLALPDHLLLHQTPLKQARSRLRRHAHRRRLGHTSSLSSVKHKHSLEERAHKCVARSTICGCKEAARTGGMKDCSARADSRQVRMVAASPHPPHPRKRRTGKA